MTMHMRWSFRAAAALLLALVLLPPATLGTTVKAQAQTVVAQARPQAAGKLRAKPEPAPPPAASSQKELPPRVPFTAAEDAVATIPGIPDARFWADSQADFKNTLPADPGPWLALSSGGEDGAFGAGLLVGLSAAGKRPDFAVVTGVSSGALMAPFAFAGSRYDEALKKAYTTVTAADIFEAGGSTGESFVNSWPLRDFIAKEMTPELMADVPAAYRAGRRLFIVTTNLDAERFVVW